jgi:hypothetical protein
MAAKPLRQANRCSAHQGRYSDRRIRIITLALGGDLGNYLGCLAITKVLYETVRHWVLKFGPLIARKLRQGRLYGIGGGVPVRF